MPQRRAESPIRIQPRAAPWVKIFQQTCALKEQKEGERVSTSLSPVALTARQLVNEHTPRVLPWAVFPLGLRPVFARNHCCYTLPWVILFLGFRLVIACNRGCCTLHWVISLSGLRPVFACSIGCFTFRWVIFTLGLRPVIAHTRGYCFLQRMNRTIIFLQRIKQKNQFFFLEFQ